MLADFDPAVAGLAAQPFQLTGPDGGRDRRHVPDLLLVGGDGAVTVVDVKAASRLAGPGGPGAVRVDARRSRRAGDGGSRPGPARTGGCWTTSGSWPGTAAAWSSSAGLLPAVLDAARGRPRSASVERALAGEYPVALVRPAVLHLLWTGRLRADLRRPLGADTPVRLAGGGA